MIERDACFGYVSSLDTFVVAACPDEEICSFEIGNVGTCVKPSALNYTDYGSPGGPCNTNDSCFRSECKDGRCEGAGKGQKCYSTYDCNPGLQCDFGSATCVDLLKPGQNCTVDFECEYDSGCGSDEKCVKLLSLNNGQHCENNMFCASMFCFENTCTPAPKSSKKLPMACTSDADCLSTPIMTA